MKHNCDFRVYYEDTDAGGIMYHASFIRFCERGRTEFLRALGLSNSGLEQEEGILFVVRHLEADYFSPGRLDDLVTVESTINEMKNSSFVMKQSIFCRDSVLFSMTVTLVCVNTEGRPVRLPASVRQGFEQYRQ